jgi:hypothetical protein
MILNGWKEIAKYLSGSVRGIQRWEDAGLPIIRPGNGMRGSVVAYSEHIDAWLRKSRSTACVRQRKTQMHPLIHRDVLQENLRKAREASERLQATRLEMEAQMGSLEKQVALLRASVIEIKRQAKSSNSSHLEWYGQTGIEATARSQKRIQ